MIVVRSFGFHVSLASSQSGECMLNVCCGICNSRMPTGLQLLTMRDPAARERERGNVEQEFHGSEGRLGCHLSDSNAMTLQETAS